MADADTDTKTTRSSRRTLRTFVCPTCENERSILGISRKSQVSGECKICFYAKLKAAKEPRKRKYTPDPNDGEPRRCAACRTLKPKSDFYRNRRVRGGLHCYCIPCLNAINKKSNERRRQRLRTESPKLWWALCAFNVRRAEAREKGLPFDITPEYLESIAPNECPILGIPIEYPHINRRGSSKSSASVDRIRPELGYVPGNVQVISLFANTLKSDGSPVDHARLVAWHIARTDLTDFERGEINRILAGDQNAVPAHSPCENTPTSP